MRVASAGKPVPWGLHKGPEGQRAVGADGPEGVAGELGLVWVGFGQLALEEACGGGEVPPMSVVGSWGVGCPRTVGVWGLPGL